MIPTDGDQITADWLGQFVGPVGTIAVEPVGEGFGFGGTSFKVTHDTGTVVVKLATAERTERERIFYEVCAPSTPIRLPEFHGSTVAGDDGAIVIEYVADARQGDVLAGCTVDEMIDLAEIIGRVHARWWETDVDGLHPRPRLSITADRIETAADRYPPPESVRARMRGLADRVNAIYDDLAAQPRAVTHRDFHLDNVLFADEPIVIDWQLAAVGPFAVDAARLLIEVRPDDLDVADARAAMEAYLGVLPEATRPSLSQLVEWMQPAFDLAIVGFSSWLGVSDPPSIPRMAALQDRSFDFVATAIELADQLR